jgi:hypothetical protein
VANGRIDRYQYYGFQFARIQQSLRDGLGQAFT